LRWNALSVAPPSAVNFEFRCALRITRLGLRGQSLRQLGEVGGRGARDNVESEPGCVAEHERDSFTARGLMDARRPKTQ
jgi:hypothetical protein